MTDKTTVWRLITHHDAQEHTLRWARKTGRIAIGWGKVGDVKKQGYVSATDISHALPEHYPGITNTGHGGRCLYAFCYTMKPGDLVIISTGKRRALVMEVTGDYEFKITPEEPPIGDYQHQRKAVVVPMDADELWRAAGSAPVPGYSIRWSLIPCLTSIDAATKAKLAG